MNEPLRGLNEKQCSIRALQSIVSQAKNLGIDEEIMLQDTGIDFTDLNEAEFSLTRDNEDQISRNLIREARDPLFALKLGASLRVEQFGMAGFATLSAETRQDAIDTFSEFNQLMGSNFNTSSVATADGTAINIIPRDAVPADLLGYYSDLQVSALVFSEGERDEIIDNLIAVKLMHQQAHLKLAYEQFFGCPVSFGAVHNSVVFKTEFLASPMPRSDSETARLCRQECRKTIRNLQINRSCKDKVSDILLQHSGAFPSIIEVAEQLNLPERTLRRHLANEGTSYKQVLSAIRFELSKEYLKNDISVDSVAALVGYSEAANFSHAFKRWAGVSPNKYKKTL